MRIALVVPHYHMVGGVERHTVELAEQLIALGHHVHIVTGAIERDLPVGMKGTRVTIARWPPTLLYLTFATSGALAMARRRGEFDIVHVMDPLSPFTDADVITVHNCHKYLLRHAYVNPIAPVNYVVSALEILAFRRNDHANLIAVSEKVQSEVLESYDVPPARITVIPHGVRLPQIDPEVRQRVRAQIRNRYGIGGDTTVVCFIAHRFKRKGLLTLLQALASVNQRRTQRVKLLVIGRDDARPYRRFAREVGVATDVIFTGALPDHLVSHHYQASDLFVLPTEYDSFCMAGLEAMAFGLPVIITRQAGLARWMRDGVHGFVLRDAADWEQLATRLDTLAGDGSARRHMGLAAGRIAAELTWERMATRTVDLYEQVLAQKRTRAPTP